MGSHVPIRKRSRLVQKTEGTARMSKVYNYEDIFEDIPGDPDNILLKFPPEMLEETGWKEGDTINIELVNGSLHISKKDVAEKQLSLDF
jgi:hypothetical protein